MTDNDRRFPSVSMTRIGLLIGVPIAVVLGIHAVSWALTLKSWNSGDTLTATDLNSNFDSVKAELASATFRAQDTKSATAGVTFSGSFADVFPAYTVSVPAARAYVVHIDVDQVFSAVTSGRGVSNYNLVVNGVSAGGFNLEGNDTNLRWRQSGRLVVQLNAGNNVLQLQAKNAIGSGFIDTSSARTLTVE